MPLPDRPLQQQARAYLRQALADPTADFRDGQWEAIEQLVRQRGRLLVVQRTGWGKSVVYFLATRLLRDRGAGPTLLISPLLALMRNQIEAAERLNVRAATINSSNQAAWEEVQAKLLAGEVDILLISPERLANDTFRESVLLPLARRIGLFVVDEAHCISDWGHDFRPDYRRIVRILQALPANIPVLATTATANNRVVADTAAQLGETLQISRGPLARDTLRLQNINLPNQASRLAWLADFVPMLPGSGIIYTLTIRDAQRVADWLRSQGIDAHAYWGGLEGDRREELEQALLANEVKALVATTALGMGFDKPDLGFVVHFQRPGSVVHYYQQVGRAGRAIEQAYGILLSGQEDAAIVDYFITTAFPPEQDALGVLAALEQTDGGLSRAQIERQTNLSRGRIDKVLKLLSVQTPAPIGRQNSRWVRNPVPYTRDEERVTQITRLREREQEEMTRYAASESCLMAFLRAALDDPTSEPCGQCAPCVGAPLLPESPTFTRITEAVRFLQLSDQPIEPRKLWVTGAFEAYPWEGAIRAELRPEQGRALSVWGDAGWGTLVKQGKQEDGRFDERLIEAVVEMIKERWKPVPFPTWVTCVPSLKQIALVPDLAEWLARRLALPFVPCIQKTRQTPPQKLMHNSYQQARNLDGAFSLDPVGPAFRGPVILVDDIVDSRWTFTVLSALLRGQGSGPVYPLALAMIQAGWN